MPPHRTTSQPVAHNSTPPTVCDPVTLAGVCEDAAHFPGGFTAGVVYPESETETAAVVRGTSRILPIGAQSSLTGGATPLGEIVLSTARLNRIVKLDRDTAIVEPGVPLSVLQDTLRNVHAWYPPMPTFAGAFAGGVVATNAAGLATFKYGSTRDWVTHLTIVLANGDILEIDRGTVLAHEEGFFEICTSSGTIHLPVPSYQMPKVAKHSAGYFARPGMDLIDLFIGSEGTLGVVTKIGFKLISPKPLVCLLLTTLSTEKEGIDLVRRLRTEAAATRRSHDRYGIDLAGVEHLDHRSIELIRSTGDDKKFHVEFPEDTSIALLIQVELTSKETLTPELAYSQIAAVAEPGSSDSSLTRLCTLMKQAGVLDRTEIVLPHDQRRRKQLEAIREAVPNSVNRLVGNAKSSVDPHIEKTAADMIVPFDRISESLNLFRSAFEQRDLDYAIWGHLSDGNLHPNVIPHTREEVQRGRDAILQCGTEVIRFGGCPLAEHGVGRNPVKQALLRQLYGSAGIDEMRQVKKALDPAGKLAPGVLFPLNSP